MPHFTITNHRKGSYTILRPGKKDITIDAGKSILVEMSKTEAAAAAYDGVEITETKVDPKAEGKPAKKSELTESEKLKAEALALGLVIDPAATDEEITAAIEVAKAAASVAGGK